MKTITIQTMVVLIAVAVCLTPVAEAAQGTNGESTAADVGLGVASFLCSVPYGAAKVSTAIVGGVVGGLTYLLSGFDRKAADSVWYTTMDGDYVVTPDHLRGKKDLRFTGVPPDQSRSGVR
jgi:hypothetical protein